MYVRTCESLVLITCFTHALDTQKVEYAQIQIWLPFSYVHKEHCMVRCTCSAYKACNHHKVLAYTFAKYLIIYILHFFTLLYTTLHVSYASYLYPALHYLVYSRPHFCTLVPLCSLPCIQYPTFVDA